MYLQNQAKMSSHLKDPTWIFGSCYVQVLDGVSEKIFEKCKLLLIASEKGRKASGEGLVNPDSPPLHSIDKDHESSLRKLLTAYGFLIWLWLSFLFSNQGFSKLCFDCHWPVTFLAYQKEQSGLPSLNLF